MAFKLNWKIVTQPDGTTRRRLDPGAADAFGLDYIDVEWTHEDGFPEDTKEVPMTHPPEIVFETQTHGRREKIMDQICVPASVQESSIHMMLDEKRAVLAKALGVEA